ncbi:MAG: farnesyl diphosphate synthase [Gammaproteobacteria bacterium]
MSLAQRFKATQDQLEVALSQYLPRDLEPLSQAMRYSVLGGGKRLRAFLAIVTAEAFDGTYQSVLPVASALECMHAYSLVHDDLPAMDNDALRRGKPTCHIAYDEATAILAGDALQALAFEILAQPELGYPKENQLKIIQVLAEAAGANGMVKGQTLDIASEGRTITLTELESIHRAKTGALIEASVLMGALTVLAVTDPRLLALKNFAHHLGIAFQIQDDILDITTSTTELGKTAGRDVALQKATYPALLGLDGAKEKAIWHLKEGLRALDQISSTDHLIELAHFIVQRNA